VKDRLSLPLGSVAIDETVLIAEMQKEPHL
jgi:hypothetical protein